MAVISPDRLLAVLEKSRLLSPEQLEEARKLAGELPDAKAIARRLVGQQRITRWQAGQLLAGVCPVFLDKYKLLDRLGRGATGRVYLAEHAQMERRVAVKTLDRRRPSDSDSFDNFLSEARAVALLDHRNLIQVFDIDADQRLYYIVTEYAEGRDWRRWVEEESPLSFEMIADHVAQAADGLAHAQGVGITHLNLKPTNLLTDDQGTVKIVDMGMVRLAESDGQQPAPAREDAPAESADYTSPEQAAGSDQVDHRADIYSLGCVLYFLLTGRAPFSEPTRAGRLVAHRTKTLPAVLDYRRDAPPGLVQICQRMTAKDPDRRYQSAEEVARHLRTWLEKRRPGAARRKKVLPAAAHQSPARADADDSRSHKPPLAKTPGAAAAASAQRWGEFSIVVKSQHRRRKNKRVATSGDDAAAAQPAETDEKKRAKPPAKPIAPGVIIGAVAGAGVLIFGIALIAVLLWSTLSDGNSDQASLQAAAAKTNPADKKTPEPANHPPADAPPAESNPGVSPPDASNPDASNPDESNTGESHPAPSNPDGSNPGVSPPDASNPDASNPDESNTGESHPAPSNPDGSNPGAASPDESNPGASNPDEPAATNPPVVFGEFPKSVDLPRLEKTADWAVPVVLGKVQVAPDAPAQVELLGGEKACKVGRTFSLRHAAGEPAPRDWEIRLSDTGETSQDEATIALLSLGEEGFRFRWTATAPNEEASDYLCNCALTLQCGGESRTVALRAPVSAEPVTVDLRKSALRPKLAIDHLPDPESLRFEITALEGDFPTHICKPEGPMPLAGGKMWLLLGEGDEQLLSFEVSGSARHRPDVSMTPYFGEAFQAKTPIKYSPAAAQRSFRATFGRLTTMRALLEQLKKRKNAPQVQAAEKQIEADQALLRRFDLLDGLCKSIQGAGRIHYRVFCEAGSCQVDLLRTDLSSPAEGTEAGN